MQTDKKQDGIPPSPPEGYALLFDPGRPYPLTPYYLTPRMLFSRPQKVISSPVYLTKPDTGKWVPAHIVAFLYRGDAGDIYF